MAARDPLHQVEDLSDWRTVAERAHDAELEGTWFRCRVHGLQQEPSHVGPVAYCGHVGATLDDDCTERVLLVHSAQQDATKRSVWNAPKRHALRDTQLAGGRPRERPHRHGRRKDGDSRAAPPPTEKTAAARDTARSPEEPADEAAGEQQGQRRPVRPAPAPQPGPGHRGPVLDRLAEIRTRLHRAGELFGEAPDHPHLVDLVDELLFVDLPWALARAQEDACGTS